MSGDPHVAALRAELVEAAIRQHRRRQTRPIRWTGAVLALVLAVAGGGVLSATAPIPALADVRIEVAGGRVAVTLEDLEHRPDRIEAAIRSTGLDVQVTAVPTGPSAVGRFLGDVSSGAVPDELVVLDPVRGGFSGFSLPKGWPGRLELRVGRPARGDEPYAAFTDALAPGEPLACRSMLGRPAARVVLELAAEPLDVTFTAGEGPGLELLGADEVAGSQYARWPVVGIDATRRDQVVVRLGAESPTAPSPSSC